MSKSDRIKQSLLLTKEKRLSQQCKVFELKIDSSKLSKAKLGKINDCFIQAKWIYNYLVGKNEVFEKNATLQEVGVMAFNKESQKCDILEQRKLTIGSQIKQALIDRFTQNIISLSKAKAAGRKIGRLKFKKSIDSIPLKQYGVTYKIYNKNTISIQVIGKLKVRGLKQIEGMDLANATLIRKNGGFFIKVTCFEPKETTNKSGQIGMDFGIKDSVVLSDGRKFSWDFEIPANVKKAQRRLSKKTRGSKNYAKTCKKLKITYGKLVRRKDDAANKFVSGLKGYSSVVFQDESIKGWHSGWFGKKVQQSILGRIKSRLQTLETSVMINRWLPTTKISPVTGKNISIGLGERVFRDGDFSEDRDIKSAKTILCLGLYNPSLTYKELIGLPLEELTSAFKRFYPFSQVGPLNEEALPFNGRVAHVN